MEYTAFALSLLTFLLLTVYTTALMERVEKLTARINYLEKYVQKIAEK